MLEAVNAVEVLGAGSGVSASETEVGVLVVVLVGEISAVGPLFEGVDELLGPCPPPPPKVVKKMLSGTEAPGGKSCAGVGTPGISRSPSNVEKKWDEMSENVKRNVNDLRTHV